MTPMTGMGRAAFNSGKASAGGGVAGDDVEVRTLGEEKGGGRDGVAGDGLLRLGAVGQAGSVAEIEETRSGDEREQRAEDGEAAETGVEDGDGGRGHLP